MMPSAMSSNTDGDSIFAFDVSKKLLDARAEGGKISFLLEAISNSSSEIIFLSRESGEGPHLLIMPYPATSPEQVELAKPQPDLQSEQQLKQLPVQATNLSESINQTEEQAGAEVPATLQATVAGATIPVAGRMQSNQSMEEELELPAGKVRELICEFPEKRDALCVGRAQRLAGSILDIWRTAACLAA